MHYYKILVRCETCGIRMKIKEAFLTQVGPYDKELRIECVNCHSDAYHISVRDFLKDPMGILLHLADKDWCDWSCLASVLHRLRYPKTVLTECRMCGDPLGDHEEEYCPSCYDQCDVDCAIKFSLDPK